MPWDRKVPFDDDGHLIGYAAGYTCVSGWTDNYEFEGILTFIGFERGRSAAHAMFKDSSGHYMQMFLADLEDVLRAGKLGGVFSAGKMSGSAANTKWTFCKRGQNFGVQMVKEKS